MTSWMGGIPRSLWIMQQQYLTKRYRITVLEKRVLREKVVPRRRK
jgi:hypothetical protein